jgi:hypothetical protein
MDLQTCPACRAQIKPEDADAHRQWHIQIMGWLDKALGWTTPGAIQVALRQN